MSAAKLISHVTTFGFNMLERGHVLDVQSHSITEHANGISSLSWIRAANTSLMIPAYPRVDDYLRILRDRNYSFLMHDASIVRLQYVLNSNEITKHCLCYWPSPFKIDEDILAMGEPVIDVIEGLCLDRLRDEMILVGQLRFDYDPTNAAADHAASHLTLVNPDCRIPVHAPLNFDTFMRFVLENFHRSVWADETVKGGLRFRAEISCLEDHDLSKPHLNWRYP